MVKFVTRVVMLLRQENTRNALISVIATVCIGIYFFTVMVSTLGALGETYLFHYYLPMPRHTTVSSSFDPDRVHPISGKVEAHRGTDFPAPENTPVLASSTGTVYLTYTSSIEGNVLYLMHPDGELTIYKHLNGFVAAMGDEVTAGQVVALSGNTGISTGPHLHFELIIEGEYIDAETVLQPWPEGLLESVYNSDELTHILS